MTKVTTRKRRYYAVQRRQKGICCGEGLGICGSYKLCDAKNRVLKVVTSRYHSGNFFSKETLRVTGMAALSITSLLSFNAEEQKSIKKKAKTIINRVMLNRSRTIKVFCEAMSTSAWQTSSTNSRFTWTRSMPSKCTSENAQGESSGEAMRPHFSFKGYTICLEQTTSVGGRNWNKSIHCLCKPAKKYFLLQRREVIKRVNGEPGTRNRSLGTSLHKEVEGLRIYWKAKQYFRNSIISWFWHPLQFYRINVTCICKRWVSEKHTLFCGYCIEPPSWWNRILINFFERLPYLI